MDILFSIVGLVLFVWLAVRGLVLLFSVPRLEDHTTRVNSCPDCSYSLVGIGEKPTCPECGRVCATLKVEQRKTGRMIGPNAKDAATSLLLVAIAWYAASTFVLPTIVSLCAYRIDGYYSPSIADSLAFRDARFVSLRQFAMPIVASWLGWCFVANWRSSTWRSTWTWLPILGSVLAQFVAIHIDALWNQGMFMLYQYRSNVDCFYVGIGAGWLIALLLMPLAPRLSGTPRRTETANTQALTADSAASPHTQSPPPPSQGPACSPPSAQ